MRLPSLAAALLLIAPGCAGESAPTTTAATQTEEPVATVGTIEMPAPDDALDVELASPEGPTRIGDAYLWPEDAERTRVLVVLPTRTGLVRPVSIREGTCEEFDRHPPFVLEDLEEGVSESVVALPFEELGEEAHAVVVLTSHEAPGILACGTIVVEE